MLIIQTHRHLRNIDYLSFVMCHLLVPVLRVNRFFFFLFLLLRRFTELLNQTRQAACAVKQSILLRCLCSSHIVNNFCWLKYSFHCFYQILIESKSMMWFYWKSLSGIYFDRRKGIFSHWVRLEVYGRTLKLPDINISNNNP